MDRTHLLDAIEALPADAFGHLATVCHDIALRLPDDEAFAAIGVASRAYLGLPEPAVAETQVLTSGDVGELTLDRAGDVTVRMSGVAGQSNVGGFK